jgi:hypothetical protein
VLSALQQGRAWEYHAVQLLRRHDFDLGAQPLLQWTGREEVKSLVAGLQSITLYESCRLSFGSLQEASRLIKTVRQVRARAGRAALVFVSAFRFSSRAAAAQVAGSRLRVCLSSWLPLIADDGCSVAVGGEEEEPLQKLPAHCTWSIQLGWRDTYVAVRALPNASGNLSLGGEGCWTPPSLDIQAISDDIVLRAHGVQPAPHGVWTRVSGLCYMSGSREAAATALANGLVCVICVRQADQVALQKHQAQLGAFSRMRHEI